MITTFADPFDGLFNLQRALEARTGSEWLQNQTSSQGPFPPINVFQQGDEMLAIIELPGVDKSDLKVEAKENTIRISGKKTIDYPEGSAHRRERVFGEFDRTLSLPVHLDPNGIKAEYRDGVLALFLPRSEGERPRTIKIGWRYQHISISGSMPWLRDSSYKCRKSGSTTSGMKRPFLHACLFQPQTFTKHRTR